MAFHPAPACHVTPPPPFPQQPKSKQTAWKRLKQSSWSHGKPRVLSRQEGGWVWVLDCHFQTGFVISTFPPREGWEGLSPPLPSPGWILGWDLLTLPPLSHPPAQAPHTPLGASGNQTATARCPFQLPKRAASLRVPTEWAASAAGSTGCRQTRFARLFPASCGERTPARVGGCPQGDAGHGERGRCAALRQRRSLSGVGWVLLAAPR